MPRKYKLFVGNPEADVNTRTEEDFKDLTEQEFIATVRETCCDIVLDLSVNEYYLYRLFPSSNKITITKEMIRLMSCDSDAYITDLPISGSKKSIEFKVTNKNCIDCNECYHCVDCKYCKACQYCSHCTTCEYCEQCNECIECDECDECQTCVRSNYCYDCSNCNECNSCEDCDQCNCCDDCHDKYQVSWVQGPTLR